MENRAHNFFAGPAALPLEVSSRLRQNFSISEARAFPLWKSATETKHSSL